MARLNQLILEEDEIAPLDPTALIPCDSAIKVENFDLMSTNTDDDTDASLSSPLKRHIPEEFKEELPLLPTEYQSSPFKKSKTVTFSEVLATAIPDGARQFSPIGEDPFGNDTSDFFDSTILPAARSAMYQAEHEQLSEADSTMRVEVPSIGPAIPPPPWCDYMPNQFVVRHDHHNPGHQDEFLSLVRSTLLSDERQWHENIDHELQTCESFPSQLLENVKDEEFVDGFLELYLAGLCFEETEIMVWKPEGLRVLDMSESDDEEIGELELGMAQSSEYAVEDMKTLLMRRQQDIQDASGPYITRDTVSAVTSGLENQDLQRTTGPNHNHQRLDSKNAFMLGSTFSATTSLSRFMQAHTGASSQVKSLPVRHETVTPSSTALLDTGEPPTAPNVLLDTKPLPIPKRSNEAIGSQRQFVVSLTLLAHRTLFRQIEHQYPTAEWIERDFHPSAPASDTAEADLILSPSRGLLFSTLQQIKQKPLPGQVDHAGIRGRIASLVNRYEGIIVLVSEGRSISPTNAADKEMTDALDERDCAAINSLIAFATQLDASVQVFYVPGGEATLATWTVSCMKRWGIDNADVRLTPDETYWELFLRGTGMNAFAAQTVLAMLKNQSRDAKGSREPAGSNMFGLPAFIRMSYEERKLRFLEILGGEKLLKRVSMFIDRKWDSEAGPVGHQV